MPNLNIQTVGTANVGLDSTNLGLTANEIPAIKKGLLIHDQASSPYLSIMTTLHGKLLVQQQEDYYWNEILADRPNYLTNSSGIVGGSNIATGVVITDPAIINGQLLNEMTSGQQFCVTAVDYTTNVGSTTCSLMIPDGTTNIQTVSGAVTLVDCGTAMIEGGDFLQARSYDPARISNTTMKSSHSILASTEKVLSQRYWGWPWDLNKLIEFTRQKQGINRAMLLAQYTVNSSFQQIAPTATKTGVMRTTRGLLPSIASNVAAGPPTGTITKSVFTSFLNQYAFPNALSGSTMKLLMIGRDTNYDIQSWITDTYRTTITGNQMFGVNLVGYIFGSKRVIIFEEPAFTFIPGLVHGMVCIDGNNVYMTQYGPNTFELKDTTPPSSDVHSLSSTCMFGNETEFEYSHSAMYNFN